MLNRVLYNDICRRYGGDLNERQAGRLIQTVKHYMGEVHRVQGNKPAPMLNKEVLATVLPDYLAYLERGNRGSGRSVVSDIEAGPGPGPGPGPGSVAVQGQRLEIEDQTVDVSRVRMDVTTAFSSLQTQRQDVRPRPPVQDFRISLQDEGAVPVDVFERIKKERDDEAMRQAATSAAIAASAASGQAGFAAATDTFSRDRRRAAEEADNAFADRERARLEARASAAGVLPPPPDIRGLVLGDRTTLERSQTVYDRPGQPSAAGNPTVALPTRERAQTGGLQQMIVTREPETMAYKETELNLFVYSGDRNWISNSTETRYNFSIVFDPSNMPTGQHLSPTVTTKFRNIVRIEIVKAIMPGEGIDLLISKTGDSVYDSSLNMNILAYPYIQVRIPELDNNSYGTNQGLNSAFGVLQYDANWVSDSSNPQQRGFLAMIPKFLKCQKIYNPTPLSTLQKLTFQFQRPDGNPLSSAPDTLDIGQIFPTLAMRTATFTGGAGTALTATYYKYDSTVENTVGNKASAYYWLQTSTWFNHWTVSKGDRILIKNLTWTSAATGAALNQLSALTSYLQQDAGLIVVDTGVVTGTALGSWVFSSGGTASYNSQGYANAILVRGSFPDPTKGVFLPTALAGVDDQYSSGYLSHYLVNTPLVAGRLLNQSHQVQVAMRVITRDFDSTGILRPDNL